MEIFTVGHSSLPIELFIDLLAAHHIQVLVDVRRFPGSRKHPQFNQEALAAELRHVGVAYEWIDALGGRRPKRKDFVSPNVGLRNDSFRNYADYMLTDAFRCGMLRLAEIAAVQCTAIMCAESVFWRCHRRLISDHVLAHGGVVQHIFPNGQAKQHRLTEGAKVQGGNVIYPGERTLFD